MLVSKSLAIIGCAALLVASTVEGANNEAENEVMKKLRGGRTLYDRFAAAPDNDTIVSYYAPGPGGSKPAPRPTAPVPTPFVPESDPT